MGGLAGDTDGEGAWEAVFIFLTESRFEVGVIFPSFCELLFKVPSWFAGLGWRGVLRGDLNGFERALLAEVEGTRRRRLMGGGDVDISIAIA